MNASHEEEYIGTVLLIWTRSRGFIYRHIDYGSRLSKDALAGYVIISVCRLLPERKNMCASCGR